MKRLRRRWSAAIGRFRARSRRFTARRPWVYWVSVAALACLVWATLQGRTESVARARSSWGETTLVYVATENLRPGEPLDGKLEVRELPVAVLPAGAITTLEPGAAPRREVVTGAILSSLDIDRIDGPLARVPAGWVMLAISESPASAAEVGDSVLIASEGLIIAPQAVVVGSTVEATLVALPADTAATAAYAAQTGQLTVLVSPAALMSEDRSAR